MQHVAGVRVGVGCIVVQLKRHKQRGVARSRARGMGSKA